MASFPTEVHIQETMSCFCYVTYVPYVYLWLSFAVPCEWVSVKYKSSFQHLIDDNARYVVQLFHTSLQITSIKLRNPN